MIKKLKKFIKYLFFLPALCFVVTGCSNRSDANRQSIIYWSSNNTEEILFAREIVNQWNKENPGNIVSFQPVPEGQSSEEIILAAVVGETTPDIYSNMWQGDVEAYAQAGVLVALDTLEGFNEFIYERCDSSVVKEITSLDGHIYQVPWKINPIMMIYNKNLLSGIGLIEPPATYSEFFEASKNFMKDSDGDGYIDRWFGYCEVIVTWWQRFFDFYPIYLAASNGAPLVEDNKAAFNNEYGLETFKFLKTLYDRNYFSRERISQREDIFLSGVIASRFTGPWEIAHADKFKPEGFEYDYTTVPVPDNHTGPAYTYGDPKNIIIFKTSSNVKRVWDFVRFMSSKENDLKLLEITNQLPRRKELDSDPYYAEYFRRNPQMEVFGRQAKYVKGTDASPVLKEVFDLISQEYEACVVYGKKTPEEALNDAEKAVNLLFLK
ncbi:MAG: extracellular solute-binding protein [Ignavibacteriaceae bacterium]